ncbi:MAG: class I SAM-dependent methyltransferase [Anaerolineales bacterium]|nr:class I SAM-dependent methyltransferase [Anaerolineales bacterium]
MLKDLLRNLSYQILYLGHPPWDTGVSPPELMAFIESRPPGRALDLGCGTGVNAITLAQRGWQAVGVDFVGQAIRQARRKARQAGVLVDFHVSDVTRLEGIDGPFDLILDIGCFHSLSPAGRRDYVNHLERLLAPGGTYLLYAWIKTGGAEDNALGQADLALLGEHLDLAQRQDGSERGLRPSAWFTYRKQAVDSGAAR